MRTWECFRGTLAAAAVAMGASSALAGNITISADKASVAVGETLTITVSSANPGDDVGVEGGLWDSGSGVGAGTFSLTFDAMAYSFDDTATTFASWLDPLSSAGLDSGDPTLVVTSLFFFDQLAATPGPLFSLSFKALTASTSTVFKVGPNAGPNGTTNSSFFSADAAVPVTPAIPEPSTYALMGLGLALVGLTARRRLTRAD